MQKAMTREELKAIVHLYGDPNGEGSTASVMEAVDKYVLSLGVQSQSLDEIIKWGQDAAAFGVTPAIYYELLTKIGNVSFQSPAPDERDENGLLPCPKLEFEDGSAYFFGICFRAKCDERADRWWADVEKGSDYRSLGGRFRSEDEAQSACQKWLEKEWSLEVNTRVHAPIQKQPLTELNEAVLKTARSIVEDMEMGREGPNVTVEKILSLVRDYGDLYAPSAGKDPEIARLNSKLDEFEAKLIRFQNRDRDWEEKSAKLIEALEEIVFTYNNCGDLKNLTGVNHIGAVAKQSLAAYKGKEGGGNG